MAPHSQHKLLETLDQAAKILKQPKTDQITGTVAWAKDGIIFVKNIKDCFLGEVVLVSEFEHRAIVMQIEGTSAHCVLLSPENEIKEGQPVKSTGSALTLPVSSQVLGRVIDPLGKPLDGGGPYEAKTFSALESPAPGIMERQAVSQPLQTGILAIDALIPIGRGQRELIIGDRQTGKSTIALDTILAQKNEDVVCVYVSIGQRDGKTAQAITKLTEAGAMAYSVVVSASASQPAALQYLAPYAGAAIAEYFMKQGRHTLVVYDDLSKHAVAYREISLLLRRPPGREAYPGDVFYLHSRLLERSAKLSQTAGAGSMTALPIIETQAGDVSAYIPTNVISITDGQIFLESKLFNRGIRPAINVGISVSRVGGAAQTPLMKKIAGSAKLALAQYYDLAAFSQFASELDEESKKQLKRGQKLVEILKQRPGKPYKLWQEAALLWTVQEGYLDGLEADSIFSLTEEYLNYLEQNFPEIQKAVTDSPRLSDELRIEFEKAAQGFFKHRT